MSTPPRAGRPAEGPRPRTPRTESPDEEPADRAAPSHLDVGSDRLLASTSPIDAREAAEPPGFGPRVDQDLPPRRCRQSGREVARSAGAPACRCVNGGSAEQRERLRERRTRAVARVHVDRARLDDEAPRDCHRSRSRSYRAWNSPSRSRHTPKLSWGAGSGSDPAPALEDQIEHQADEHHEPDRHRVSEAPAELGHVLEVHAVDRADQRRSEQDRRPGGDLLHLLVLVDRHLVEGLRLEREMHAEDVLEEHAEAVDPFLDAFGVILYVAEVPALLLVDAGEVDQLAEDARERFRRALELDHLACQLIRAPR